MKKLTIAISILVLVGCASQPKVYTPAQKSEIIQKQNDQDKVNFTVRYVDLIDEEKLKLTVEGRLRNITLGHQIASEKDLTIVKRGKTATAAALTALVAVSTVVASGGAYVAQPAGFRKEQLKGSALEPTFANPTLEYVRPILHDWLLKNASGLAPADKPLERVAVEPNRYVLVYDKLAGKEAYHLHSEMTFYFYNDWNHSKAYAHRCQIKSKSDTLANWQAHDYAKLQTATKDYVSACIRDLNANKVGILTALSKN